MRLRRATPSGVRSGTRPYRRARRAQATDISRNAYQRALIQLAPYQAVIAVGIDALAPHEEGCDPHHDVEHCPNRTKDPSRRRPFRADQRIVERAGAPGAAYGGAGNLRTTTEFYPFNDSSADSWYDSDEANLTILDWIC